MNRFVYSLCALTLAFAPLPALADGVTFDARTAHSGNWSHAATWENGRAPRAGDMVQVRPGHTVTYDVKSDDALKLVHVAGTLRFSREKSTRLDVGLLKVQPGEECSPDGFTCAVHQAAAAIEKKNQATPAPEEATRSPDKLPAALEIGTPENPIPPGVTATIRLVYFQGSDKETLPALVTCGGRLDLHGAPMNRTWVKLAQTAEAGAKTLTLAEPVTGWRRGDKVSKPRLAAGGGGGGDGTVSAPMQGTIVKVLVAQDDAVEPGQALLVLEAMKMENHINAERGGTVKEVRVAAGDTVGTGDVLIVIE